MIRVEVFVSPACHRCEGAVQIVQNVVKGISADRVMWRRVDVLEEIDYAVELGVLATPAIAVDGILVFTAVPPESALREAIEKRMTGNPGEQQSERRQQQ